MRDIMITENFVAVADAWKDVLLADDVSDPSEFLMSFQRTCQRHSVSPMSVLEFNAEWQEMSTDVDAELSEIKD